MAAWDGWKKGFDAWEDRTAKRLETALRSPRVLRPGGALLTAAMRSKSAVDGAMAAWWSALGLPTRRDQERAQHALNQLQSRLIDLEEEIAELRAERAKSKD
ncbi:MAG: hypothetical protein JWM10_1191 [Myxococcaceae bacterium]|nr:hypothetical protein [Myxococcaceae bacterium]